MHRPPRPTATSSSPAVKTRRRSNGYKGGAAGAGLPTVPPTLPSEFDTTAISTSGFRDLCDGGGDGGGGGDWDSGLPRLSHTATPAAKPSTAASTATQGIAYAQLCEADALSKGRPSRAFVAMQQRLEKRWRALRSILKYVRDNRVDMDSMQEFLERLGSGVGGLVQLPLFITQFISFLGAASAKLRADLTAVFRGFDVSGCGLVDPREVQIGFRIVSKPTYAPRALIHTGTILFTNRSRSDKVMIRLADVVRLLLLPCVSVEDTYRMMCQIDTLGAHLGVSLIQRSSGLPSVSSSSSASTSSLVFIPTAADVLSVADLGKRAVPYFNFLEGITKMSSLLRVYDEIRLKRLPEDDRMAVRRAAVEKAAIRVQLLESKLLAKKAAQFFNHVLRPRQLSNMLRRWHSYVTMRADKRHIRVVVTEHWKRNRTRKAIRWLRRVARLPRASAVAASLVDGRRLRRFWLKWRFWHKNMWPLRLLRIRQREEQYDRKVRRAEAWRAQREEKDRLEWLELVFRCIRIVAARRMRRYDAAKFLRTKTCLHAFTDWRRNASDIRAERRARQREHDRKMAEAAEAAEAAHQQALAELRAEQEAEDKRVKEEEAYERMMEAQRKRAEIAVAKARILEMQQEHQKRRQKESRAVCLRRMKALWEVERTKLISTQIEKERAWFQTPVGATALKKLVWHVLDSVEYEDPPLESDIRSQKEMNLPWQLQFLWQDVVRVWRNMRTGETIGPKADTQHTAMNRTIATRIAVENYVGERLHEYQTRVLSKIQTEFEYQIMLRHYCVRVQRWWINRKVCRAAEKLVRDAMLLARRDRAAAVQQVNHRTAIRIQCAWRQRVARDRARVAFSSTVIMLRDPESEALYYFNTHSGDAYWRLSPFLQYLLQPPIIPRPADDTLVRDPLIDAQEFGYTWVPEKAGGSFRYRALETDQILAAGKPKGHLPCAECDTYFAILRCLQCGDPMCEQCFSSTHAKGARQRHRCQPIPIGAWPCCRCSAVCDSRCGGCGDAVYCEPCHTRVHKGLHLTTHPAHAPMPLA